MNHGCPGVLGGQKRLSGILKMKLQMAINHCMGAGNLTCALNPLAVSPALRPVFIIIIIF